MFYCLKSSSQIQVRLEAFYSFSELSTKTDDDYPKRKKKITQENAITVRVIVNAKQFNFLYIA